MSQKIDIRYNLLVTISEIQENTTNAHDKHSPRLAATSQQTTIIPADNNQP